MLLEDKHSSITFAIRRRHVNVVNINYFLTSDKHVNYKTRLHQAIISP